MLHRIRHDRRVRQVGRYGVATVAPAFVSATHLVMQLAMLRAFAPADFGLFAFMIAVVQFGFGLSNALVATPYTVCLNGTGFSMRQSRMFFHVSMLFALAWGLGCAGLSIGFEAPALVVPFGIFGALSMLRWFGRATHYAHHQPVRAAVSDLAYGLVLLASLAIAWLLGFSLATAMLGFIAASLAGLVALGRDFLSRQFLRALAGRLSDYGEVWQTQSRWTLLGVTTTELTANAHSYLVMLVAGPTAFAPLAAASLFFKPVQLCATSLAQLERPSMTRAISARDLQRTVSIARTFRLALMLVWLLATAGGLFVLAWNPGLVFHASYEMEAILTAFALWAAILLVSSLGTPENVLLQAMGAFHGLAMASVVSSIVSIVGAALLLWLLDPIASLTGVLLGQAVMVAFLFRTVSRWRMHHA